MFLYMAASTYHVISREAENRFFRHNSVFRHTCLRNQPKLTKKWYYIYFVQILYSHLRYTDRLLNFFFLLLAVILSELQKNLCEEHHFFGCMLSFLYHILSLFSSNPILRRKKKFSRKW